MYTQKNFVSVTTIQLIIFYINNHKVAFCNHRHNYTFIINNTVVLFHAFRDNIFCLGISGNFERDIHRHMPLDITSRM